MTLKVYILQRAPVITIKIAEQAKNRQPNTENSSVTQFITHFNSKFWLNYDKIQA
jgi:hypothetical protein